jgi:hypothetical protein
MTAAVPPAGVIGGPDQQGLAVTRRPGGGWQVVHTWVWRNGGTGLPVTGEISRKRDAQTALAEFLATGCNFTASPEQVRQDPTFPAVRRLGLRWGASDGSIRVPAVAPACYAVRNSDGTIHATNTIGTAVGSHHVHDAAGFQSWQQSAPEFEVEWLTGGADCTCGNPPGSVGGLQGAPSTRRSGSR